MSYAVKIEGLCFSYPGRKRSVLEDVNFSLRCGEIAAVTGPSGSGKTTLCYCITGIIPHILAGEIKGSVRLFEKDVREMKVPHIAAMAGIIFQDPDTQLFSPTVEDEIAFAPENLCMVREEIGRRINNSLELTGMQAHRFSNPSNLSGGEKKLIAVSSVLSLDPWILVFDEPLSLLDRKGKNEMKKLIKALSDRGKAVIMVEHDSGNLDIADRVLVLDKGMLEECPRITAIEGKE
jgi:energy-coupling factor transport system ATP-binding protein